MIWWATTRRARNLLLGALVLYALLLLVSGGATTALPSLTSTASVPSPLALMAPVLVCASIGLSLEAAGHPAEISGIRNVRALDTLLAATVITAAGFLSIAGWLITDAAVTMAAGRNTAFLAGFMLALRSVFGSRAVLAPPVWILVTILLGYEGPGDPYWWTIIAYPLTTPHAAVAALLMLIAGLTVLTLHHPRKEIS